VTHVRSGASSGFEVELPALGGRVTMVEAEPVPARATHDQLALRSSGSAWTTSGFGPASMS
jgi:arylamine N-acetyltransferase